MQPWHALLPRRAGTVAFTPQALAESTAVLRNPDQGFYRIVPYTLNEEGAAGPVCGGKSRKKDRQRAGTWIEGDWV